LASSNVEIEELYIRAVFSVLLALAAPPHRVGSAGVTVALPPGWHSTQPIQGAVTNPLTRFVVSSGPIRADPTSSCQVSAYAFPRTAVAIVVVEWTKPIAGTARGTEPPLPRHITAADLRLRPHEIECFAGSGGSIEFAARGHTFAAYVLLGTKAPARLAERARAVLDTLRIAPR
jgi:hypothetical protein